MSLVNSLKVDNHKQNRLAFVVFNLHTKYLIIQPIEKIIPNSFLTNSVIFLPAGCVFWRAGHLPGLMQYIAVIQYFLVFWWLKLLWNCFSSASLILSWLCSSDLHNLADTPPPSCLREAAPAGLECILWLFTESGFDSSKLLMVYDLWGLWTPQIFLVIWGMCDFLNKFRDSEWTWPVGWNLSWLSEFAFIYCVIKELCLLFSCC